MTGAQYGPGDYDTMFADRLRTDAYLAAIRATVRPGDVVVEVGTGLGYFAVAACRAGARHVYAIERTPSVFLAERVIQENGLSAQVTCVHGDAGTIDLPERASVYLADLRGMLPLSGDAILTVAAVRRRLLRPDARLIPVCDTIYAAPCRAPHRWREVELTLGDEPEGIARREIARFARSVPRQYDVSADELVTDGEVVAVLDFATIISPDVDATVEWTVAQAGRIDGIALWFEADLGHGIRMSTAPGGPRSVYSNGFLPLERPIDATDGDRISCRIRAKLVAGDYVYAWDTTWVSAGELAPVTMRQSALGSLLVDPAEMRRRKGSFIPEPASVARSHELLGLIDGTRTQAEIAAELGVRHPSWFTSDVAALTWVADSLAALEQVRGGDPGRAAVPPL